MFTSMLLAQLLTYWQLKFIFLAQGAKGSILMTEQTRFIHPGLSKNIIDIIGTGNAFNSATMVGLFLGRSLKKINRQANRLAVYVFGQAGSIPKHQIFSNIYRPTRDSYQ